MELKRVNLALLWLFFIFKYVFIIRGRGDYCCLEIAANSFKVLYYFLLLSTIQFCLSCLFVERPKRIVMTDNYFCTDDVHFYGNTMFLCFFLQKKKDAEENPPEEKEEGEKDDDEKDTEEEDGKVKKDDDDSSKMKKTQSSEQEQQQEQDDEDRKQDEKYERMEASMRKREQEVRAQKELYEKDREKERGIHLHDKAVQHFKALLADMVRIPLL